MSRRAGGKELPCLLCGKVVYVSPSRLNRFKYCSRACADTAQTTAPRRPAVCARCGAEFTAKQDHGVWQVYCSRECFEERSGKRVSPQEKECLHCGTIFLAHKSSHSTTDGRHDYCSRACANIGKRRQNELTCECCGASFSRSDCRANARYCSRECQTKMQRKEQAVSWKGGIYKDNTVGDVRVLVASAENGKREKYMGEHRVVAAQTIGRMLDGKREPVIHLNMKKDDNRPENLYICQGFQELRDIYQGRKPWPKGSNLSDYATAYSPTKQNAQSI